METQYRVLFIEDDDVTRKLVKLTLEKSGFLCDVAEEGDEGLRMSLENDYDAVMIDLGLPFIPGLDIIEEIRKAGKTYPIVIYTSWFNIDSKVAALEKGADDYITKPLNPKEMDTRLRALIKRRHIANPQELSVGEMMLFPSTREVGCCDHRTRLSNREFQLLYYLAERKNTVVPKKELLEHVWGYTSETSSNVVEVHMSRLRKHLAEAFKKKNLYTLINQGFMLKDE